MPAKQAIVNQAVEWSFTSARRCADPSSTIELDVVVTDPDGVARRVPAFWAGGDVWRVRYAATQPGRHRWRTECSDPGDGGLHGREGELEAEPYEGANPLLRHGPIRVSADRRHFEHADGRPFFWLGDTWWMGLTKRLDWAKGFRALTADRVAKGFTVVQIVAGLYPDMPWRDERGANEAGFPWQKDFRRIDPAYFDRADRRIRHLVDAGLVPCIVGCWGYFLPWMGVEKMKRHWRNLIARWGAYPVIWCLAGEGVMPYYLSTQRDEDARRQKQGWTEIARYVRSIDPYHRLVTIHPTDKARNQVEDPAVLDFDMLQTGHSDMHSAGNHVESVRSQYAVAPPMPVLVGEVSYEGIGDACGPKVQRFMFWSAMLNGAAGHTYGANGIWQVNRRTKPYGPSPHGMSWGDTPWDEAAGRPGSAQLGLAKRLLERYEWWRFEPHPEWVDVPAGKDNLYVAAHVAGIPGRVRIIYTWCGLLHEQRHLERNVAWRAFLVNPRDGSEHDLGPVRPDVDGKWKKNDRIPIYHDWLMVLEAPPRK